MISVDRQFDEMVRRSEAVVKSAFPIESPSYSLNASNFRWSNLGPEVFSDIPTQKECKLKEKTLAAVLKADLSITDKSGRTIDRFPGYTIFMLPHLTARASYIVDGNEVQTVNQLRLRPGPYTRFAMNDDTETFINAAGGGFRIIFSRQTGILRIKSGTTYVYAYPVLKALGITDRQMAEAWGSDVLAVNAKYDDPRQLDRLYRSMRRFAEIPKDPAETATMIDSFFRSKSLDPQISNITMGSPYDRITPALLLDACTKAVKLAQGKTDIDDTESMAFKSIHSVEDFVPERLEKALPGIKFLVSRKMEKTPKITTIISPDVFTNPVKSWFLTSEFTRYSTQQNPIDMASTTQLTTTMGEGGIQSDYAVTDQLRVVHPSQMGFIDPMHTPEGHRIGVTGHLTIGTEKIGNRLVIQVINAKTGNRERKTAQDLAGMTIAAHDQYNTDVKPPRPVARMVKVKRGNDIILAPAKEVDYIFLRPESFFSAATDEIPFVHTNSPNRVLMADRHIEQAVPLVDAKVPLVQSRYKGDLGYDDFFGKFFNISSPVDGEVVRVSKNEIKIKDKRGTVHVVPIHENYPLNGGAFLNDTPIVKVGDKVKEGQRLAENNFTRNGSLALGTTLKVAYLPYKGQNFEDGIVISESAAKKLTSEHQHNYRLDISQNIYPGLKRWLAHFPDKALTVDMNKYDSDGIIKKGAIVKPNEVLIPAVEQSVPHEEYDYAVLHKSLKTPWRDVSITWDGDVDGEVTDVIKSAKFIRVVLKTHEPAQIGDKLSGRAGQKGIIVNIIPDNEMYRDERGNIIDVLFNPDGMIGRINPGQLFEGIAGKIAEKTGKKYLVDNFSPEPTRDKIMKEMKAAGVKDTERLTDPVNNKVLDNIFVGNTYFIKLQHQVSKKFSARGIERYTADAQPSKVSGESAQNIGSGEIYALLSAGALHFLKDAATLKSNYNPEYWRALQAGLPTPPPRAPFILDKFTHYLEGAGINMKQEGSNIKVLPMTDKEALSRSMGEIKNPGVVRAIDLRPEAGGLFDKTVTGGFGGVHWNHIKLETPIPNPLMERPIISVARLKPAEYKAIVSGTVFVTKDGKLTTDPNEGLPLGEGLKILLSKIDVDKELRATIAEIRTATGNKLDELNKRRRYLMALKSMNLRPEDAYIQSVVPVIPAAYRPIYPLPDGSLNIADPNHSYREILLINNQLKDLREQGVDNKNLARIRADLFAAVQGTVGITEPLTRAKHFKGFISTIKGRVNKFGLFQGRVVKRPQDLSARSTVIPDPLLGLDEVGIPEDMAMTIYRPFVVRRLVNAGQNPSVALDLVKAKDPLARNALLDEMKERPVYMNRAPSLHRFSMMPFKPRLIAGKAINVNPLIVSGYNMDFDGDQQFNSILVHLSESAILEARRLMGDVFIEDRRMTARLNLTIPAMQDGDLFLFHLEDFPHLEMVKTTQGERGLIEWYPAISGTRVLAYDETTGKTVWAEVSIWSKHIDRIVEIVDMESGRQIFADDDPRAVYGIEKGSLDFVRRSPSDAMKRTMWVPRAASIEDISPEQCWIPVLDDNGRHKMRDSLDLNEDLGYLLGALAGDGWVSSTHGIIKDVCLSYGDAPADKEVADRCDRIVSKIFQTSTPEMGCRDSGEYGKSHVAVWCSAALGSFVEPLIGCGAENKHLPPFFLSAPESFRKGLFAGLMDTDGSLSISRAKRRPQLMGSVSSKSLRLLQETRLLAATLKIDSRITSSETPAGLPFWTLSFSSPDLKRWGGDGMIHAKKLDVLKEAGSIPDGNISRRADNVPISFSLAEFIRKNIPASRGASKEQRSLYVVFGNARTRGSVARDLLPKLLKIVPEAKILAHPDGARWLSIARNERVKWDRVVKIHKTHIRKTGYDLTVPGYETFMSVDGVILSNTVGIHVPVSEEARKEALEQLPSKNLFAVRDDTLMHLPSKETVLGIYLMTEPKGTPIKAASLEEMMEKFKKNEIKVNTAVSVAGKIWTPGQVLINDVFPSDVRPGNVPITKKILYTALFEAAKKYPKITGSIIDKLKNYGNHYVTDLGFSIGLKDLMFDAKVRDQIMAEAAAKARRLGFETAHNQALDKLTDLVKKQTDNRLVLAVRSGASGKSNEITQMIATPVAVSDHRDRVIPVPITRSYAEGHDLMSYWSTIPGSRKGLMQKGLGTQDTGAFAKRLMNTTITEIISIDDCKTTNGIAMPVESRDALDRVIADGPHKGKILDTALARSLVGRGVTTVKVRSPMHCQATTGVCAKCFGLLQNGKFPPIGYHIGALVGQTISEPMTQLMLRAFHTGGAMGKKMVAFDRVEQIFEMPENLPGKATLAMTSGKVTSIEKGAGGGWIVNIGNTEHFVPLERGLAVKKGDQVKAGQKISMTGVIKPQELLAATNDIERVRRQILDDLDQEFTQGNVRVKRKIFETAIKPMTDRAEVTDAGDGEKYHVYRGDVVSVNRLEEINRAIRKVKGRPIQYKPTLLSLSVAPYHSGDFIGQLMFDRPHQTIMEAPGIAATVDLRKAHPITQYAFGVELGKKK